MEQEELSPHCSTGQGHDFLSNYFMGNSTSAYEFAAYLRGVAKDFDRAGFDATADDFKAAATYIDFLQKQVAQFLVETAVRDHCLVHIVEFEGRLNKKDAEAFLNREDNFRGYEECLAQIATNAAKEWDSRDRERPLDFFIEAYLYDYALRRGITSHL